MSIIVGGDGHSRRCEHSLDNDLVSRYSSSLSGRLLAYGHI
ncbi:hypothetical protein BVRB_7g161930 [Beta vulgaris subsp. vulgaris]|nr:hypothetical protein BVRB_7g161930 [Beta vulgaris subsp. vulgaris]